jgi:hypothetical protein
MQTRPSTRSIAPIGARSTPLALELERDTAYHFWYVSGQTLKKIAAAFYRTSTGTEPVRDWLKGLSAEDRREIEQDIATVEYGWPVGMPVSRPLGRGYGRSAVTLPATASRA